MSKKLEEKQQRRLAEERRKAEEKRAQRRRSLVTLSLALVVGLLVVALIAREKDEESGGASGGVSAAQANCEDVETLDEGARDHVEDGTDVDYETSPPTSGPHYGTPAQPGFFSSPALPEQLVHNLEHGQIVIWFDPAAPEATIDAIEAAVSDEGVALLASPYDDMPTGSDVVFTAWAAMQECADFSSAVLDDFRGRFQGRGPEQVGIPTFDA